MLQIICLFIVSYILLAFTFIYKTLTYSFTLFYGAFKVKIIFFNLLQSIILLVIQSVQVERAIASGLVLRESKV